MKELREIALGLTVMLGLAVVAFAFWASVYPVCEGKWDRTNPEVFVCLTGEAADNPLRGPPSVR